jgi:hypothetical protein
VAGLGVDPGHQGASLRNRNAPSWDHNSTYWYNVHNPTYVNVT